MKIRMNTHSSEVPEVTVHFEAVVSIYNHENEVTMGPAFFTVTSTAAIHETFTTLKYIFSFQRRITANTENVGTVGIARSYGSLTVSFFMEAQPVCVPFGFIVMANRLESMVHQQVENTVEFNFMFDPAYHPEAYLPFVIDHTSVAKFDGWLSGSDFLDRQGLFVDMFSPMAQEMIRSTDLLPIYSFSRKLADGSLTCSYSTTDFHLISLTEGDGKRSMWVQLFNSCLRHWVFKVESLDAVRGLVSKAIEEAPSGELKGGLATISGVTKSIKAVHFFNGSRIYEVNPEADEAGNRTYFIDSTSTEMEEVLVAPNMAASVIFSHYALELRNGGGRYHAAPKRGPPQTLHRLNEDLSDVVDDELEKGTAVINSDTTGRWTAIIVRGQPYRVNLDRRGRRTGPPVPYESPATRKAKELAEINERVHAANERKRKELEGETSTPSRETLAGQLAAMAAQESTPTTVEAKRRRKEKPVLEPEGETEETRAETEAFESFVTSNLPPPTTLPVPGTISVPRERALALAASVSATIQIMQAASIYEIGGAGKVTLRNLQMNRDNNGHEIVQFASTQRAAQYQAVLSSLHMPHIGQQPVYSQMTDPEVRLMLVRAGMKVLENIRDQSGDTQLIYQPGRVTTSFTTTLFEERENTLAITNLQETVQWPRYLTGDVMTSEKSIFTFHDKFYLSWADDISSLRTLAVMIGLVETSSEYSSSGDLHSRVAGYRSMYRRISKTVATNCLGNGTTQSLIRRFNLIVQNQHIVEEPRKELGDKLADDAQPENDAFLEFLRIVWPLRKTAVDYSTMSFLELMKFSTLPFNRAKERLLAMGSTEATVEWDYKAIADIFSINPIASNGAILPGPK